MRTLITSKKVRIAVAIIGTLVLALLLFGAGMLVGYRRGMFASRFGEEYYHNFVGEGAGPEGMTMLGGQPLRSQHGAVGVVIDISDGAIVARDVDGDEESIAVATGTVIRKMDQTITLAEVEPGEGITVIGEPNAQGQIEAKFIRIFPSLPPGTPPPLPSSSPVSPASSSATTSSIPRQ